MKLKLPVRDGKPDSIFMTFRRIVWTVLGRTICEGSTGAGLNQVLWYLDCRR